jgi:hypothetical protein
MDTEEKISELFLSLRQNLHVAFFTEVDLAEVWPDLLMDLNDLEMGFHQLRDEKWATSSVIYTLESRIEVLRKVLKSREEY